MPDAAGGRSRNTTGQQKKNKPKKSQLADDILDSISEAGSEILGVFGMDAKSKGDREKEERDAEYADRQAQRDFESRQTEAQATADMIAQLAKGNQAPAAPVAAEKDNTLLYVVGGTAALLTAGAIAYAATR